MKLSDLTAEQRQAVQECLGYLNFSSGAADPKFLRGLNALFAAVEQRNRKAPARALGKLLAAGVAELRGTSEAFRHLDQAEAALALVFDRALPAYRGFHADLLAHPSDEDLFRPFFLGRMCEAVLRQGPPWDEADRVLAGALTQINDYLGYRPVAVLRSQQKLQPYAHEWVAPIPLYLRDVGVAAGRYAEVVAGAMESLRQTPADLLFPAFFDLQQLDELALDPRAYDFDHPNSKRPNYIFGQWDMGRLDLSGRCRRFVVQQLALDTLLEWIEQSDKSVRAEAMVEAAGVLAGTMLMGSGVSGNRPDAHDSTTTLATLVQRIAGYRDEYYEWLMQQVSGAHAARLREEAAVLQQPFGGIRQFFNRRLAQRRAEQVQHVSLAYFYARIGHSDAAASEVRVVPVPAARMRCDIFCRLNEADQAIAAGRLEEAAARLPQIEDLLRRGVECGAVVDPWNVLGFGGQYSLFPAPENSIHDTRIDDLIDAVSEIFGVYVSLQKAAAAAGQVALREAAAERLAAFAGWWDKYAVGTVGEVPRISGQETCESAALVASALGAWHDAGTAAGDLAFWRQRAAEFRSAKAYALVVEALLQQRDLVAAMALLMQWLSQSAEIPLYEDDHSFHDLTLLWMEDLWEKEDLCGASGQALTPAERWGLARKFLDYLEANAEELWQVPRFALGEPSAAPAAEGQPQAEADDAAAEAAGLAEEAEDADQWNDLFGAAYEGVTYRDSADDGVEGEVSDSGSGETDFELVEEGERIVARLQFLNTVARLWRLGALASLPHAAAAAGRDEALGAWQQQAAEKTRAIAELMAAIGRYRIPPPRGTHESLLDYDRRRGVKEMLLEEIIGACVEMTDAARMVRAAMGRLPAAEGGRPWERAVAPVLHALLRADAAAVRGGWRDLTAALVGEPLLYVALGRGGNPQRIAASRGIQRMLQRLLAYLPKLGLLRETFWLLESIQDMEFDHPVGPGAITEFDQVFEIGCKAIVKCLADSSATWRKRAGKSARQGDMDLIGLLEQTIESLLRCWLAHSRGVRLSVLETIGEPSRWNQLKRFIERYGHDLFTQQFMILGNLRAILHEGVEAWLEALAEEPDVEVGRKLLADLGGSLPRDVAAQCLSVAIEAAVEYYPHYVDYNTTTTQSDRGEMLHALLDFLRLLSSYDRVAWNLRPILLAHEVLVRRGYDVAAEIWRQAIAQRTEEIADEHQRRFARLSRKYGMRLLSIEERLAERFVKPLAIDRLRALVRPAVEELKAGSPGAAFAELHRGIEAFKAEVTGPGLDLPPWLEALDQESDRIQSEALDELDSLDPLLRLPQVCLSLGEARKQVNAIVREG